MKKSHDKISFRTYSMKITIIITFSYDFINVLFVQLSSLIVADPSDLPIKASGKPSTWFPLERLAEQKYI